MSYCSVSDIRLLTDLQAEEIGDGDLASIITYAVAEINAEIGIEYNDEKIQNIDTEKENDIDGSNTTFYVKHPYLGDRNNDGAITSDDLYVYTIDSDGTRSVKTVSSVDWRTGKFVLSAAPSTSETLYATYLSVKIDCDTPHQLIKKAAIELSAAIAYSKVEASNFKRVGGLGGLSLVAPETYNIYYQLYRRTILQIRKILFVEKKTSDEVSDFMKA